jgi:hypothetical protein
MLGLLELPVAARIGEAQIRLAMRKAATFAVWMVFDTVASFGTDERMILAGFTEIPPPRG